MTVKELQVYLFEMGVVLTSAQIEEFWPHYDDEDPQPDLVGPRPPRRRPHLPPPKIPAQ